jgi:hypothetical protein
VKQLMGLVVLALALSGCATVAPTGAPQTFADMLGSAYMTVDTVADTVYRRCQNTFPTGPCAEYALISTEQKEDVRETLEHVLDALDAARALYLEDKADEAYLALAQAQRLLAAVERSLVRAER